MLSRRGFFGIALGAFAAPIAAKLCPPKPSQFGLGAIVAGLPKGGTVYGINQATFTFWRAQSPGPVSFDHLREAMRDVYARCESHG